MNRLGRGRIPLRDDMGIARGSRVSINLDGVTVEAFEGETVAAVIVASEGLMTRASTSGQPRGIFCGMGVCFECLVVVDGVANTRACMTLVADGMRVERQLTRLAD